MVSQRLVADASSSVVSAIAVCPIRRPATAWRLTRMRSLSARSMALGRWFALVIGGLRETWVACKVRQNHERVAIDCRRWYLQMLTRTGVFEDVRRLETPFLVRVGDRDPGLDATVMERTSPAWHPAAELQVIGNCGHYRMQECPLCFAPLVEAFLRRHSG